MEYRFIHYGQYDPGEEENKILEAAITLYTRERDASFLTEVAAFIAKHTQATYVIIGLLTEDNQHVQTRAFLRGTEVLQNITYSLSGTPCDNVFIQRFCYYPCNVAHAFPEDKELQDLQVESYLGTLLLTEDEPLGLVALMSQQPLENSAFAEHLILLLSSAIEEELTRQRQL